MIKSTTSYRAVRAVFLCCAVFAVGDFVGAEARPSHSRGTKKKPLKPGIAYIGQRPGVAEGNRASLRALARLIRKYPREPFYAVAWKVRLGRGPLSEVTTLYIRSEKSLQRQSIGGTLVGRPLDTLVIDGIAEREIFYVVRQGGDFEALTKLAALANARAVH